MPRSQRRPTLVHPEPDEFDLLDILHALSDPTRMTIVRTLRSAPERACGTFPVEVAPSTLTHHFRVLREAGIIRQREDGNRRWTALRGEELGIRFPGLLDAIVTAYGSSEQPASTTGTTTTVHDLRATVAVDDPPVIPAAVPADVRDRRLTAKVTATPHNQFTDDGIA